LPFRDRILETGSDLSRETHVTKTDSDFSALLELRAPAYGLAFRILGAETKAEDAVQEAFLSALRQTRDGVSPRDPRAWFLTIVANSARKQLRSSARLKRREEVVESLQAGHTQPEEGNELLAELTSALTNLDEKYRLPVALCYEQGLSQREAAEVLNVPQRTLARHVETGLKLLHDTLVKRGHDAAPSIIAAALLKTAPVAPASLMQALELMASQAGAGAVAPTAKAGTGTALKTGGLMMKLALGVLGTTVLAAGIAMTVAKNGQVSVPAAGGSPPSAVVAEQNGKGDDTVPLGSPTFFPSAGHPYGWRGDGSGRYPEATPPLHWGQVSKAVKGLRAQAARPKAGENGAAIGEGVIHEWLVLGPVAPEREQEVIKVQPGSSDSGPTVEDKAGDLPWKKFTTDNGMVDFTELFGAGKTKDLAFAHAYVYSESKAKVRLSKERDLAGGGNSITVFVNGIAADCNGFVLEQGWNRLLVRVPCGEPFSHANPKLSWSLQPSFYGATGNDYVSENILWNIRTPGYGIASPVIAGNNVFVLCEERTMCCVDKNTGKIRWAHSATCYDAATEDEKKAHPEIFKEIAPLAARLAELDKSLGAGAPVSGNLIGEKFGLEKKIDTLMHKVDKARYNLVIGGSEGGHAARTPVTDGKHVFTIYDPCLTVCYDLDGNVKWTQSLPLVYKGESHGWYSSPALIGGKLIFCMYDDFALDAETGKLLWQTPSDAWGSSVTSAKLGNDAVALFAASIRNPTNGESVARLGCYMTTPVVNGDTLYNMRNWDTAWPAMADYGTGREHLDVIRLTAPKPQLEKTITAHVEKMIAGRWLQTNLASPLYHDGLVYAVDVDGILLVMDPAKGEVVYQKFLDLDNGPGGISRGALSGSPALAGKNIYIFGNQGTCLVIEPGRQYKQLARNRIEFLCTDESYQNWEAWTAEFSTLIINRMEQTISCPAFEGKRMYCRGSAHLYCVEEK
jgi:RNA polymerase sigma-70 factor (ECF subfamily)